MTIPKTIEGREYQKFTENSDGNTAVRVVITEPSPEDAPPPTNLSLSNNEIEENKPNSSLVGTLSVIGGTSPIAFTIDQDIASAFEIFNNELRTSRVLNSQTEPILNVVIRCTDNNGKFTTQNFTIYVTPVSGFVNNNSYKFNGNSFILVNDSSYVGNAPCSWWAWIKSSKPSSEEFIFNSLNGSNNSGVSLSILNGAYDLRLRAIRDNGNEKNYRYQHDDIFNGKWHLVGFSIQNGAISLYVDGTLMIPNNILSNQNTATLSADGICYLGSNENGTSGYYNGLMDEIAYSDVVLNQQDWLLAYNDGIAPNIQSVLASNKLRNWYRAENDVFPTITDVAGSLDAVELNVTISPDSPTGYNNFFSVEFDGATNYFLGSGVPSLLTAKTFSFWVKRITTINNNFVVACNASSINSSDSLKIYFDNNANQRLIFRLNDGSSYLLKRFTLGSSSIGLWNHICITFPANNTDANNVKLYHNAVELSANQTVNNLLTVPSIANTLSIGSANNGSGKINALIDEYSVINKELSQLEVDELYNLGKPDSLFTKSFTSDVVQWWRFGDKNSQGAVLKDQVSDNAIAMIGYDINFYSGDVP
jgi:hypothetical protein